MCMTPAKPLPHSLGLIRTSSRIRERKGKRSMSFWTPTARLKASHRQAHSKTASYFHPSLRDCRRKFYSAVSRMISRSGVCGLNFTKRSSFSTSGLRRRMSSKPGAYALLPVVGNQSWIRRFPSRASSPTIAAHEFEHGNFLRATPMPLKISPRACWQSFPQSQRALPPRRSRGKSSASVCRRQKLSAARFFRIAAMKRGKTMP